MGTREAVLSDGRRSGAPPKERKALTGAVTCVLVALVAAYLAHWAKILKDRPSALLEASGHAQRAVDHLIAYSQAGSQAVAQAA